MITAAVLGSGLQTLSGFDQHPTGVLLLILSGAPGCTWLSQLLSLLQSGSVPQPSLPFMIHLKSAGPLLCLGLMLCLLGWGDGFFWSQKWGTYLIVSYWGPCNKHITGGVNHYHWLRCCLPDFSITKLLFFLLHWINTYFEVDTLRWCANLRDLQDDPDFWHQLEKFKGLRDHS